VLRLPAGRWSLERLGEPPLPLPAQPAPGGGQWLWLPPLAGVTILRLQRDLGEEGWPAPAAVPPAPVRLRPERDPASGAEGWRLENGRLAVRLGPGGVEQLWDASGRPCLAAPLAWRRWADRGEFWDAWDIAADHRDHPLPWSWEGPLEWPERGPLCARFLLRGRCGASRLRLDGRLLADSPMLELTLSVDWRQRHELLRLEVPLARPALRWAADMPGGVIERPAAALTGRERARWEVAAWSWLASVETAGGGGLAVLLDGPQGVSADPERLGVSLLRAPTWPDPGADNGPQRQRLALMPCPAGWRADGVGPQAQRLREPLWCRPLPAAGPSESAWPGEAEPLAPLVAPLPVDLQLVGLRPSEIPGTVILTVLNLGPRRRHLPLSPGWRLLERLDGLDRPLPERGGDPLALAPWQLGFWRLAIGDQSS
jgi:alpha-mannosidase